MAARLLNFRVTFAVVAVFAMLAGAVEQTAWLAAPGAAAAAISDFTGILQCRMRFDLPTARALRGAAEFLPPIGVAAFEPLAIGVTVVLVSFALAANGMSTVARARGLRLKRTSGETLRRFISGIGGLLLLTIPVAATTSFSFSQRVGSNDRTLVAVVFAVVLLAALRALLDMALELRKS
jgi:hypothetical protein